MSLRQAANAAVIATSARGERLYLVARAAVAVWREGEEEHAPIVSPIPDALEGRDPVLAARDRFPVDDARPRAQPGEGLDDEREAVGQAVPRAAIEIHPLAIYAGDHPEAVVLDFVQPLLAGGRLRG